MALTKAHNRMIEGASVNVKDYGATGDGVTDDTVAIQAAIDYLTNAGNGGNIILPAGNYVVTSVTIDSPIHFQGESMSATRIWPVTGYSTVVVAYDNVTVSDLEFIGDTGTGQADITGSCIKFDAYTNNNAFARAMEGCKIERVKFRNLKMNGIYAHQCVRESHIRECRFVGMGDVATDAAPIKFLPTVGSTSNVNNIWIDKNMFYRFATPAIYGKRSVVSGAGLSYASMHITGNLIHGMKLDESTAGGTVQPEDTDQIYFEDCTEIRVIHNKLTAVHPLKCNLNIVNATEGYCKSVIFTNNNCSLTSTTDGVTYTRGAANAVGSFIRVSGSESAIVSNNQMYGGVYVNDIDVEAGVVTSIVDLNISGNVSQAGEILTTAPTSTVRGLVEQSFDYIYYGDAKTKDLTVDGIITAGTGLSKFTGSTNWSIQLKSTTATNGCLIGTPANNQFQVSTSGGSPLLVVQGTSGTRPGTDNSYSSGTASYRWSTVYAGTGTINTSDENEKQQIESLSDAENRVAAAIKGNIKKFKFNDAVEAKGDSARIHIGVIAQEVKAMFEAESLDASNYALFCSDTWWEADVESEDIDGNATTVLKKFEAKDDAPTDAIEKTQLGIRYEELLAFIISTI